MYITQVYNELKNNSGNIDFTNEKIMVWNDIDQFMIDEIFKDNDFAITVNLEGDFEKLNIFMNTIIQYFLKSNNVYDMIDKLSYYDIFGILILECKHSTIYKSIKIISPYDLLCEIFSEIVYFYLLDTLKDQLIYICVFDNDINLVDKLITGNNILKNIYDDIISSTLDR